MTGRGPRLLDLSRRDLPEATYFVLAQGATVLDLSLPDAPRTLLAENMPAALVADVIATLEASLGQLSVLVEPVTSVDIVPLGRAASGRRF